VIIHHLLRGWSLNRSSNNDYYNYAKDVGFALRVKSSYTKRIIIKYNYNYYYSYAKDVGIVDPERAQTSKFKV
jgi:hypothetical protein